MGKDREDIIITPEMVEIGVDTLRDFTLRAFHEDIVERVYLMMELERRDQVQKGCILKSWTRHHQ